MHRRTSPSAIGRSRLVAPLRKGAVSSSNEAPARGPTAAHGASAARRRIQCSEARPPHPGGGSGGGSLGWSAGSKLGGKHRTGRGPLAAREFVFHSGAEQQVPGVMAAALPRRVSAPPARRGRPTAVEAVLVPAIKAAGPGHGVCGLLGVEFDSAAAARMSRIDAGAVSAARRAAAHQRGALARGQTRRA
jgi:hypothetical protein